MYIVRKLELCLFFRHGPNDVRVSWVCNRKRADTEIFTTGRSKFNVVSSVMMNSCLSQHSIIFNFRFSKIKMSIISFQIDYTVKCMVKIALCMRGLKYIQIYLKGGVLFAIITNFAFPWRRVSSVFLYPRVYLPDFITRARRELMDSTAFFCFFCVTILKFLKFNHC